MQKFQTKSPTAVAIALSRAIAPIDHFMVFDNPRELAKYADSLKSKSDDSGKSDFYGKDSWDQTCEKSVFGDLALVAKSDAFLQKFETLAFQTKGAKYVSDVVGSAAHVQNFVLGLPNSMRRRVKVEQPSAPIVLAIDLTTSAALTESQLQARGVAALALARVLCAQGRAVSLYAFVMLDSERRDSATIAVKLESAPLNLAIACHVLTSASFPRRLCYSIARADFNFRGGWPYGDDKGVGQKHAKAILTPMFARLNIQQVLVIPPIYKDDLILSDPAKWIEQKILEASVFDV